MKYIRTKDGIYEIYIDDLDPNEETSIVIAGFRAKYCRGFERPITKEDILKISDTIKELCDEFVYEYQTGARVTNKKIIAMPDIVKTYGAIWTEKGLIYVAKMNKKGELELL